MGTPRALPAKDRVTHTKLARLKAGKLPRVLDLFSGCGGFSLGFLAAGFRVLGGVEIDSHAARVYSYNIHGEDIDLKAARFGKARDITNPKLTPQNLLRELTNTNDPTDTAVDIIVGGPPCQPFSRSGRAKLRDVHKDRQAHLHDPRSRLYVHYLEYVESLRPLVLVIENVPDFLKYGNHNIADEICEVLSDLDYQPRYTLLNAANYGVPQFRERLFIVAYAGTLGIAPEFPEPTHYARIPEGYWRMRESLLAYQNPNQLSLLDGPRFKAVPPLATPSLPEATTVRQAIEDLIAPQKRALGEYAKLMRYWPAYEVGSSKPSGCEPPRPTARDKRVFSRMNPGDKYPEAYRISWRLAAKEIQRRGLREGSDEFKRVRQEYGLIYDATSYPDKWRKLRPDEPSHTLPAHLGKDRYSHIHYDPREARTLSVREAARLQSFPDGFTFPCPRSAAYRQIGNAVPPLLAWALARNILTALLAATALLDG